MQPADTLLHELGEEDPENYKNYTRMNDPLFQYVLEGIRPFITKKDTIMHDALSPELKLIVTLPHLACGWSYKTLSYD